MQTIINELATYHEVPSTHIQIGRDFQSFLCYSSCGSAHFTVNLSKSGKHIQKNSIRTDRS
jgi:hypothetical protein